MQGLFGSQRQFVDTTQTVADEAYIKESILQPEVRVVEGFGQEMPSFIGILSENEIQSITMYIKSLSEQE
ncbi:MAG: hypothetical protein U5K69_07340 [Balneolaceae bacterium]|nr:hypothetical protein [Balneolaceae bacterium]